MEVHSSLIQPEAADTSTNHAPSHEEISRRAYEIYLEHGGQEGNELEDWLQAERELQKVARFTQDWSRLHRPRGAGSGEGN